MTTDKQGDGGTALDDRGEFSASRRAVLKAVGAGAVGTTFVGGATAQTTTADEETESLDAQLDRVRKATSSFTDAQQAMESGFRIVGPPIRHVGWFFINLENVGQAFEGNLDITKPQLLTYTDELELGAVVYAVPQETEPPSTNPPNLFNDEDAADVKVTEEDGWGRHESANHVFANSNGTFDEKFMTQWADGELVFESSDSQFMDLTNWVEAHPAGEVEPGQTFDAAWEHTTRWEERVADIVFTHPDLYLLYAWVHAENPEGIFNTGNPEFYGGGGH